MAENKKSFVIYCDLRENIDHLTIEEKGMLFDHLLDYVNDKNPTMEDRVVLSAWKPIERQLKRDLKKFEEVKEKRKKAGQKSAELRAIRKAEKESTNSTHVKSVEHRSTNSTVNDNDNDNVNVNDNVNDTTTDVVEKGNENDFKYKLIDIDTLYKNYLQNKRVIKAVLQNKKNNFKNAAELKKRLQEFVNHQKENSVFKKTEADFASHFRYWHKSKKDGSDTVEKIKNQIPIG